jgi:hypothetical protein
MHLEIKSIASSDIRDLETWVPQQPEDIFFAVSIVIGSVHKNSGDEFQLTVATPEAIRARNHLGRMFFPRHWLIIREYQWEDILARIQRIIAENSCDTWLESAGRLSRYFDWEFEDYQE